jgi:hypothetical protein
MPKQTNRYQRLVLALNELPGPDADVQESREFIDSVTGAKREVDVCIETGMPQSAPPVGQNRQYPPRSGRGKNRG